MLVLRVKHAAAPLFLKAYANALIADPQLQNDPGLNLTDLSATLKKAEYLLSPTDRAWLYVLTLRAAAAQADHPQYMLYKAALSMSELAIPVEAYQPYAWALIAQAAALMNDLTFYQKAITAYRQSQEALLALPNEQLSAEKKGLIRMLSEAASLYAQGLL